MAGAAREPGVISRSLMSFNEDFPLQIGLEQGGRREVRRFRLRCVGPEAVNEPSRSFTVLGEGASPPVESTLNPLESSETLVYIRKNMYT